MFCGSIFVLADTSSENSYQGTSLLGFIENFGIKVSIPPQIWISAVPDNLTGFISPHN